MCDVLIRLLQEQFGPSQRYQYETWGDWKIEVGARWHDQIQAAIDRCDFGLLLVSPAFLSSKYIDEHELPHFVNGSKPMIPVCAAKLNFDRHALKGLEENQIFFGSHARGRQEALSLVQRGPAATIRGGAICKDRRAPRLLSRRARPSSGRVIAKDPHRSARRHETEDFLARLAGDPVQGFVRTRGASYGLRDLERIESPSSASDERGIDAIEFLDQWAGHGDQPPFCAVLGEYGIGKTTTLQQLTRHLLEKRRKGDTNCPLPIFVDLRDYVHRPVRPMSPRSTRSSPR